MKTRMHTIGDDAGPIPHRRWRSCPGDPDRKEQAHTVRPPEVEVFTDHRFEEESALHRPIEDLRQTDFELINRQAVVITGAAVGRGERPRELMRPAIEE